VKSSISTRTRAPGIGAKGKRQANIDVVKKRSNVWLWVIALVVLAVVLFALFGMGDGRSTGGIPVSDLTSPALIVDIVAIA
jgi:hypothetical protein